MRLGSKAGFWTPLRYATQFQPRCGEAAMRHEGITVFLLFFGLALLEAIAAGQWARVLFWLAVGVVFVLLDRRSDRDRVKSRRDAPPLRP